MNDLSASRVRADLGVGHGNAHGVGPVLRAKLPENPLQVDLYRLFSNSQRAADFLVLLAGTQFLKEAMAGGTDKASAVAAYVQMLLSSTEFRFID